MSDKNIIQINFFGFLALLFFALVIGSFFVNLDRIWKDKNIDDDKHHIKIREAHPDTLKISIERLIDVVNEGPGNGILADFDLASFDNLNNHIESAAGGCNCPPGSGKRCPWGEKPPHIYSKKSDNISIHPDNQKDFFLDNVILQSGVRKSILRTTSEKKKSSNENFIPFKVIINGNEIEFYLNKGHINVPIDLSGN